jgi:CRP/FNR family transcriptional regulator, cyclic AMP receptor protein
MEIRFRSKEDDTKKVMQILHKVPIFSELGDETLKSLLENASEETFHPNQTIVKDGSFLANLYIILGGSVEVRKKGVMIAKLAEGQFFGEMAFLNDKPTGRSADIVALEETRCLSIKGPVFYAFLRNNPDIAIEVIRTLANRLRQTNWALSQLQNLPEVAQESNTES